jgi:hypothetical protein
MLLDRAFVLLVGETCCVSPGIGICKMLKTMQGRSLDTERHWKIVLLRDTECTHLNVPVRTAKPPVEFGAPVSRRLI